MVRVAVAVLGHMVAVYAVVDYITVVVIVVVGVVVVTSVCTFADILVVCCVVVRCGVGANDAGSTYGFYMPDIADFVDAGVAIVGICCCYMFVVTATVCCVCSAVDDVATPICTVIICAIIICGTTIVHTVCVAVVCVIAFARIVAIGVGMSAGYPVAVATVVYIAFIAVVIL